MSSYQASDVISVGWLVENKIISVQIGGSPEHHTLTILETLDYDDVVVNMLNQATHKVHILLQVQTTQHDSYPSVSKLRSLQYPRHPRTDHVVVINKANSSIVRFFMSIVRSLSGVKLKGVETMDEALKFLKTLDAEVQESA